MCRPGSSTKTVRRTRPISFSIGMNPEFLSEALHELFTVDSVPKRQKQRKIVRQLFKRRNPVALARDAFGAFRALT